MSSEDNLFSEREGIVPMSAWQREIKDRETKMAIYNAIHDFLHPSYFPEGDENFESPAPDLRSGRYDSAWEVVYRDFFWADFCSMPVDEYRSQTHCTDFLKNTLFRDGPWDRIFKFVERILSICSGGYVWDELDDILSTERAKSLACRVNSVLERSKVDCKISDNEFVRRFPEQEEQEVKKARDTMFEGAKQHIKKARVLFSDRKTPDYENSIKESISAVESIAKEITGKDKALTALTQELKLHPNFKKGLDELYKWTSKVVRHGIASKDVNDPPLNINPDSARFMLVICSAFVNYIISLNPNPQKQ